VRYREINDLKDFSRDVEVVIDFVGEEEYRRSFAVIGVLGIGDDMKPSTQALENQFMALYNNLFDLEARCSTADQLDTLHKAVAQSRDNYNAALRSALQDGDPEVAALTSQMGTIQVTLDQEVKDLGDIASILNVITKAVDIGSKLAAKAGGL
jgi:hypothetical protein